MTRLLVLALVLFAGSFFLTSSQTATAGEVVHFQCKEWKAKHIHDAKKADKIAATLKKLKCEIKKEQHNGHIDIKYRCEKQMDLPVKSHAEAMKWEKWFKEYGFKVYHTH